MVLCAKTIFTCIIVFDLYNNAVDCLEAMIPSSTQTSGCSKKCVGLESLQLLLHLRSFACIKASYNFIYAELPQCNIRIELQVLFN